MSEIKAGDLVYVIGKPHCDCKSSLSGTIHKVIAIKYSVFACIYCGKKHERDFIAEVDSGKHIILSRLKKIDPPEHGDSLPTRADLPIKETA